LHFSPVVTSISQLVHPTQFTWETLMMEPLATEKSDEDPDDGALSSSGDEFEL
jgi:hypothetical protein